MPTDTERREVARRLRAYLETPAPWHLPEVVSDVLGDKGDHDRIAHLAELIEPSPSCEFRDAEEKGCYSVRTVRPVDRDALLALADRMDRDGKMQRERQRAGEHWFIDGLDVREYARRIREACGEEVRNG